MNRRTLLQGLLALPVAGTLTACRSNDSNQTKPSDAGRDTDSRATGTLKVVFQGPFAVVLQMEGPRRVKSVIAFTPFDPSHEFHFGTPGKIIAPAGEKQKAFKFDLPQENIQRVESTYVDHGFDDVTAHLDGWKPGDASQFVSVTLPPPDIITYFPPAEPVQFVDRHIGTAPLSAILEYRTTGKVQLRSDQLGEQPSTSIAQLYSDYKQHWSSNQGDFKQDSRGARQPRHPERDGIERELSDSRAADINTFYFAVGVAPGSMTPGQAAQHAVTFYNDRLLASFPNSPKVRNVRLLRVLESTQLCATGGTSAAAAEDLSAAVFHPFSDQPRLLQVAAIEECKAPIFLGTNP